MEPTSLGMPSTQSPADLLKELTTLRAVVTRDADALAAGWKTHLRRPEFAASAHNLASYLALRRHDLSGLQRGLTRFGLSSLGRSESRVLASLDAVSATLALLAQNGGGAPPSYPDEDEMFDGAERIAREAEALFGPEGAEPRARIMVTLPSEAATEPELLLTLVEAGIDCVRINCAHDTPAAWHQMIANLRRAERALEKPSGVRVLMDLGGPKVRTLRPKKSEKERYFTGDKLLLMPPEGLEHATKRARKRGALSAVGCTLTEPLAALATGDKLYIDDGQIEARALERVDEGVLIEIVRAPVKGKKIASDKGLNFPDTDFQVASLTDKDRQDLGFVAEHADMIGYSFVQTASDVDALLAALAELVPEGRPSPALVLKIETKRAIRNLPELMVSAAGRLPSAVMIARGDLAIELGFERIAEMQEEMLWLCEAAHVPVIWATQVLEGLAKDGLPTRAEVTDAAMANRAECVMLNKGPHVLDAIQLLDDVLRRMQRHQYKKTAQLRVLRAWDASL
jgi:pyruvate kinase